MQSNVKITIITPFFKVAPYIKRCAESLLAQTLEDIEFLFVDDASPDDSRIILEGVIRQFPDRNVRILTHEQNKGLPAARNTGIKEAHGDFIFHCDSDDWIEPDMMERMYETAIKYEADLVYCDFWMQFEKNSRYMSCPSYSNPEQLIKEGFLAGTTKYNVWNKLVKRQIYLNSNVSFPEGHGMGEDMTMILLAMHAKKTAHVPYALYHYVKLNSNAFSNSFSQRKRDDIMFNTLRTIEGLKNWDTDNKEQFISFFKLNIKLPFLLSGDKEQFLLWKQWFPEANTEILHNPFLSKRTVLVQWLAAHNMFFLVSVYSFLINEVYYKIKFRI